MQYKIIYTADIHGNVVQYKKLVKCSIKNNANAIIIGGDLAPKNLPGDCIKYQRDFLENKLPMLLGPLQKSDIKLFLMMGNDDCACNLDILEKNPHLYLIHKKRLPLTEDFDIVGYSYVPITPFKIKDWEKFDLSDAPTSLTMDYKKRKKANYNLNGFKSTKNGRKNFRFTSRMEKLDSIQKDFEEELFTEKPNKTVYIIHTPPDKTNLDQVESGQHRGSMAVRLFIEKYQPYLTLHGHIHETVDVSSDFKEKIGKTLCMSIGNYNNINQLALLEFDLFNPEDAKRMII